ncbi:uncharacterized protein BX663DRAFT_500012 [Cokeromyces recurvatus]|uniref:uncharacterized protein n=1 Tax=Cokeromyces recurvatus TaxID=90255 RepID=UPI00221F55CA|nr:uncharacterized protein BX663DRAFT_500012 [Cokeromyces recurvatus]KAI7905516.1 hypothetical protein BX663DRAFT_500012 [Cokeromyces recurvatus]
MKLQIYNFFRSLHDSIRYCCNLYLILLISYLMRRKANFQSYVKLVSYFIKYKGNK